MITASLLPLTATTNSASQTPWEELTKSIAAHSEFLRSDTGFAPLQLSGPSTCRMHPCVFHSRALGAKSIDLVAKFVV